MGEGWIDVKLRVEKVSVSQRSFSVGFKTRTKGLESKDAGWDNVAEG